MWDYETLDSIADSIVPVLAGVTVVLPTALRLGSKIKLSRWLLAVVSAVVVVYGVMFLDKALGLWHVWNSDYSTHSAGAIAMVVLWSFVAAPWFIGGIVVFCLYAILMVYQGYHSWLDILSTIAVVAPLVWAAGAGWLRRRRQGVH